jgi:tetratricopeptide (TPR) repeat protein
MAETDDNKKFEQAGSGSGLKILFPRSSSGSKNATASSQSIRTLGTRDITVARNEFAEIAHRYFQHGKFDEAEKLFKSAVLEAEQRLPENHPEVLQLLDELAWYYVQMSRLEEAEPILKRVFEETQKISKDDDLLNCRAEKLASLYERLEKYEQARAIYHYLVRQQIQNLGLNNTTVVHTLRRLAECLTKQNDHASAEALYMQVLAIEENEYGKYSVEICATLQTLVSTLLAQNKGQAAEMAMLRQVQVLEKIQGHLGLGVATALLRFAELLTRNGKRDSAEPIYKRVLEIYRAAYGEQAPSVVNFKHKLEVLYPSVSSGEHRKLFGVDLNTDAISTKTDLETPQPPAENHNS